MRVYRKEWRGAAYGAEVGLVRGEAGAPAIENLVPAIAAGISAIAGAASAIAPIVTVASGVASIASSIDARKDAAKARKQQAAMMDQQGRVVPMGDPDGGAPGLALLSAQRKRQQRAGLPRPLVGGGGQLGDASAPMINRPLVLGKV